MAWNNYYYVNSAGKAIPVVSQSDYNNLKSAGFSPFKAASGSAVTGGSSSGSSSSGSSSSGSSSSSSGSSSGSSSSGSSSGSSSSSSGGSSITPSAPSGSAGSSAQPIPQHVFQSRLYTINGETKYGIDPREVEAYQAALDAAGVTGEQVRQAQASSGGSNQAPDFGTNPDPLFYTNYYNNLVNQAAKSITTEQPEQPQEKLIDDQLVDQKDLFNKEEIAKTEEQKGEGQNGAMTEEQAPQPKVFKSELYVDPVTGEQRYGVNPAKVEAYGLATGVGTAPVAMPKSPYPGLTPQQVMELDAAAARVAAGTPGEATANNAGDLANLAYAAENFGYVPPGADGERESTPEEDAITQMRKEYNLDDIDPGENPADQFRKDYQNIYEQLGLSTVKDLITDVINDKRELEDELNDKIQDINDNPWLTEGVRKRRIASLQQRYSGRLENLTSQYDLYTGLYDQGQQEAQFIATNSLKYNMWAAEFTQDLLFKEMDIAEKQANATKNVIIKTNNAGDITAINEQTGEVMWTQKGVATTKYKPGGTSGSSSSGTSGFNKKEAEPEMNAALAAVRGGDGYVSPDDWTTLKNQWIEAGGNPGDFESNFKGYKNPDNKFYK